MTPWFITALGLIQAYGASKGWGICQTEGAPQLFDIALGYFLVIVGVTLACIFSFIGERDAKRELKNRKPESSE